MKTKADVEQEKWVTCLHESAHVVLAVTGGRRVTWVTIKPKRVMINGVPMLSIGRWDTETEPDHPGQGLQTA